jgi:hypothetical protein
MRNPYSAVLRIYGARVTSSLLFGTLVIVAGVLLGSALALSISIAVSPYPNHKTATPLIWLMTMCGFTFLSVFLWTQFRDLVVSESGRLWPGYRRPNVLVFVGLAVILCVVLPVTIIILARLNSLGLLTIAMALFAANGWQKATRSLVIQLAFVCALSVLWIVMAANPQIMDLNPSLVTAVAIIVVSIAIVAMACLKLLRMTDDNPAFRRANYLGMDISRPRMTGDVNQVWVESQRTKLFGWPGRKHRVYLPKNESLWEGARRWRSMNSGVFVFMALMAGIMTAVSTGARIEFHRQQAHWHAVVLQNPQLSAMRGPTLPNAPQTGSFILLIYLAILPITGVGHSWIRQWRFLEIESLRPILRDRFLKQVGVAIGIQMLQAWAIFACAYLVDTLFLELGPVDMNGVTIYVAGSLGALVFGNGLLVWSIRYRSNATGAIIICGMATAAYMGLVAIGINSVITVSSWIEIIPVLLTVFGMYAIRDGCRRWLVTDLG